MSNSIVFWKRSEFSIPFNLELNPSSSFHKYVTSYLFYPVSLMMGIAAKDCKQASHIMGLKLMATPFVAYKYLGVLIQQPRVQAVDCQDFGLFELVFDYSIGNLVLTMKFVLVLAIFLTMATVTSAFFCKEPCRREWCRNNFLHRTRIDGRDWCCKDAVHKYQVVEYFGPFPKCWCKFM
ncbi:hypothetical protein RRG08_025342 [Elysia crispata]|uniref:Concentrative nucleoside transporter C-terminal domain-containing protein n=1 Tax=Elysia crispata TaxID=231223 RepID=A0AAE1DUS6_9GAST|nr:hypothetical protein RRG08_025342 [Elysia crispata]